LNQNGGGSGGGHFFIAGGEGGSVPTNFSLPITIVGTNTPTTLDGSTLTIASGKTISGTQNADDAMISSAMASKNNLKVGSTFTAYSSTLTVTGIFSSSTQGDNNTIIVSLPTEQSLSGQSGDVTSAVATVDSLDNLSSVTTAIKNKLGSAADVTSSEQQADETVQPLNSVKSVAVYSLIGAVIAGSVIILLTMIMIVRERRREIGVLKAIGATNARIIGQFMAEAVTLTVLGALVGMVIGIAGSNPVTHALVNSSSTGGSTNITLPNGGTVTTSSSPGGGGGGRFFGGLGGGHLRNSYNNLHAIVGWDILLYGLGVAILIAIIGSAFASSMIAKIRPSEVMRTE
jgi:putative ABC transport system permease protein